jgi:hypothetical protein
VAVGDFNGDGHPDIAVTSPDDNSVSVLLGTGKGGFGAQSTFGVGDNPQSVVVGDFNGDGNLDLAVANEGDNTIGLLLGTGTGSFGAQTTFPAWDVPIALAVGDFNGDGQLDVAVTLSGGFNNVVNVLLGTGKGSFQSQTSPPIWIVGSFPAGLASGDFNGDGKSDLAVANQGGDTVSVLISSCR